MAHYRPVGVRRWLHLLPRLACAALVTTFLPGCATSLTRTGTHLVPGQVQRSRVTTYGDSIIVRNLGPGTVEVAGPSSQLPVQLLAGEEKELFVRWVFELTITCPGPDPAGVELLVPDEEGAGVDTTIEGPASPPAEEPS